MLQLEKAVSKFTDDLDAIDASVFSGDVLENLDDRKELKDYAERWLRAIARHEAVKAERQADQAWDHAAEQLTRKALGDDVTRPLNMNATNVSDL